MTGYTIGTIYDENPGNSLQLKGGFIMLRGAFIFNRTMNINFLNGRVLSKCPQK